MTTESTSDVRIPRVLWAQRKDILFVTLEVVEAQGQSLNVTDKSLNFSATEGDTGTRYAVNFEFYEAVDPTDLKESKTDRSITLVIKKADVEQSYWPRLVKVGKPHFVHTDFGRWKDEDDEDDDASHGMPEMDFSQFAGMAGAGGFGGLGGMDEDDDDSDEGEEEGKESHHEHGPNCSHGHHQDAEDPYQTTKKSALAEDD